MRRGGGVEDGKWEEGAYEEGGGGVEDGKWEEGGYEGVRGVEDGKWEEVISLSD